MSKVADLVTEVLELNFKGVSVADIALKVNTSVEYVNIILTEYADESNEYAETDIYVA